MSGCIHYIVIPDGIAADKNGVPIKKPSFVYRQVLEQVAQLVSEDDTVYLAPANQCGGAWEHELGYAYLMRIIKNSVRVLCPHMTCASYVDTFGNALHLKRFLNNDLGSLTFELVCAYIHSYRAAYCFKKAGFHIARIHRVFYTVPDENIVRRWWYYKYKLVHYLYELLAYGRDIFREPV